MTNSKLEFETAVLVEWRDRQSGQVIKLDSGTSIDSYEIVYLVEEHLTPSEFIALPEEFDCDPTVEDRKQLRQEIIEAIVADPEIALHEVWDVMVENSYIFLTAQPHDYYLFPDEWATDE